MKNALKIHAKQKEERRTEIEAANRRVNLAGKEAERYSRTERLYPQVQGRINGAGVSRIGDRRGGKRMESRNGKWGAAAVQEEERGGEGREEKNG